MNYGRCYTGEVQPSHKIILAGATFIALVPPCFAATLTITPSLDATAEEASARADDAIRTDMVIEGKGDRLKIVYSSPVRIDVDLAPRRRGTGYDPAELLYFTLPAGEQNEAIIDLTPTPGWSPFHQEYHVYFSSPEGGDDAEVKEMTFLPASFASLMRAFVTHLSIRDTFQVSTFHALRGYSILGASLSFIIGMIIFIAALVYSLVRLLVFRNQKPATSQPATFVRIPLLILTLGTFAYSAFFGIDLARFTVTNLTEWYGRGTYAKAGAASQVAEVIQKEAAVSAVPLFIFVCHDTTDFYTKMLRYFLYPIPVSMKQEDIPRATHVVVAYKLQWAYENGLITCGNITGAAKKIADFPDGSALFSAAAQ